MAADAFASSDGCASRCCRYDEPKISVTGICYQIGGPPKPNQPNNGLSTFAQFTGRAVRKIASGDGFITAGISVNEKRDNIAHVVSSADAPSMYATVCQRRDAWYPLPMRIAGEP